MNAIDPPRRSLWRQPLVHFLLAAAAIFALYALRGAPEAQGSRKIVVTVAQVERMAGLWQKTWGRPPTEPELQALVRDYVREEVYYREALKLGLDVNDTVIRRRLRQKMEFLTTDDAIDNSVDDNTLQAYYQKHADRYRNSPVFDFVQVYFAAAHADQARQALTALRSGTSPEELGDPISLPGVMKGADVTAIARRFGSAFYAELGAHEAGEWFGPIESGMGLHLVKITGKEPESVPALQQIRALVQNDWLSEQSIASRDRAYKKLRAAYDVEIEVPAE